MLPGERGDAYEAQMRAGDVAPVLDQFARDRASEVLVGKPSATELLVHEMLARIADKWSLVALDALDESGRCASGSCGAAWARSVRRC